MIFVQISTARAIGRSQWSGPWRVCFSVTYNFQYDADDVTLIPEKPDIIIRYEEVGWPQILLICDAKYRIDASEEYRQQFGSFGPPRDAINVLHRYRDAILEFEKETKSDGRPKHVVVQAVAAFPYSEGQPHEFQSSRLWQSIDRFGIGAVPALPSNLSYMREWLIQAFRQGGWAMADRAIPKRPSFAQMPLSMQRDIREFFGNYKNACEAVDALLFEAGNSEMIDAACLRAKIGRLTSNALYLHRSAISSLEPILRVFEGCAKAYLGDVDDANVVKLHRFSGKVSYLACPKFETHPHPPIRRTIKLSLRNLFLQCIDHSENKNPLLLDQKERMIEPVTRRCCNVPLKMSRTNDHKQPQFPIDRCSSATLRWYSVSAR